MGSDATLQVGSGVMGAYVAEPTRDARGAVVVVQEAFGVNDHIRDIADRFADAGYVAIAPRLFHRSGDPELGYEDMTEVMPYIMQLQADEIEADLEATFDHLKTIGFEGRRVAVVGFCMGGSVSFVAGCFWPLGAAVTFYGGGITQSRFGFPPLFDLAPTLQTPWLGLFGDLDGSIPINEVEGLEGAVGTTTHDTQVVRYPDANHGFHCDVRSSYHESSAKDAWQRTLDFLDEHVG
jgi:carboxymethylenebutenolidase